MNVQSRGNPTIGQLMYSHQFIKLARQYWVRHAKQEGANTEGFLFSRQRGETLHYQTVINAEPTYTENGRQVYGLPYKTLRTMSPQSYEIPVVSKTQARIWNGSTYSDGVTGYLPTERLYYAISCVISKAFLSAIENGQVWDDNDPIGFVTYASHSEWQTATLAELHVSTDVDAAFPNYDPNDFICQQNTFEWMYYSKDYTGTSNINVILGLYFDESAGVTRATPIAPLTFGPQGSAAAMYITSDASNDAVLTQSFYSQTENYSFAYRESASATNKVGLISEPCINHAVPGYTPGFEGLINNVLTYYWRTHILGDGTDIATEIGEINTNIQGDTAAIEALSNTISNMQTVITGMGVAITNINNSITSINEAINGINASVESMQHTIRRIDDRVTACEVAIQELQPGGGGSTFTLI